MNHDVVAQVALDRRAETVQSVESTLTHPTCRLSVVIVSWNTSALLAVCLRSLYADLDAAALGQYEVLVVDNASNDDTCRMVREQFPDTRLIQNSRNVGFARANNQAIHLSTGAHILLLNPDTEVLPGSILTLLRFLERHPAVGAVGPRVLNSDGTLQESCHPLPTLSREVWRLFHLDSVRPYAQYPLEAWGLDTPRSVDALLGACMLVRRDVLTQTGLLDEDYFIYSEEVDLCARIGRANWSVYWVPQAQIVHFGGQSTRQVPAAMFLRLYEGKILYFRKHHGVLASRCYKAILATAGLVRLALSPLALFEPPPKRQRLLTLSRMYWRLLTTLPFY